LKHRGPDWSGLHQHGDCFLAHQRLAIVDPASGDQPLFNEDKSIIVTVSHFFISHMFKKIKIINNILNTDILD
jgi:asparagine synthase (glutamine-hydrolysing)